MKFTRVNKDTVNCIITEDDMDEQGLKLEDLFDKSKEAMDFLHDVMERAAQEVDYKPTGAFTSMQITVLPDHSISLTLSENAEEAFADMLKNLTEKAGLKLPKNFLEELGDVSEEERIPKLSEYLQNLKEFTSSVRDMAKKVEDAVEDKNNGELSFITENDSRKTKIKKDKKDKKRSEELDKLNFTSFVFEYDSLRTVIRLSKQIPKKYSLATSLYKDASTGKYYMLCDRKKEKSRNFASVFSICYEFGKFVTTKDIAIYHMDENFDIIIKEKAVERLRKL
jgi:adapter protein MecA 1/2